MCKVQQKRQTGESTLPLRVLCLFIFVLFTLLHFSPQTLSNSDVFQRPDRSYTYLHLVQTPRMRRVTLLAGVVGWVPPATHLRPTPAGADPSWLSVQVRSCFHLLRHQPEHQRLWAQHVPDAVHLWRHRGSRQDDGLRAAQRGGTEEVPSGEPAADWGLHRSQHLHPQRQILHTFVMLSSLTITH